MASLSRRKFLQLGSLFGTALALESLLEGCATFRGLNTGKRWQKEINDFTPVTIRLIPFQNYYPPSAEKPLDLEDKMLETYLTKPYSLGELDIMIMNSHIVKNPDQDPVMKANIKDYQQFNSEVLSVAQELGYSKEQVQNLSIHEAVMLSGRIVAKRLEYEPKMLSEEPDLPPQEMYYYLLGKVNSDNRTEEAKKIDSSSKDEIFHNGKGICRNYAAVNVAVFEILKDLNPNLKNTQLRYYHPDRLEHVLQLPHGWNLVSTITETATGKEVHLTYVDPTWLDTRNETADNSGKKNKEVGDEEVYDAVDGAHFGKDALMAQIYQGELLECLGNYRRTFSIVFPASYATGERYQNVAYAQWLKTCNKILDAVESKPDDFEKVDGYFAESFKAAAENLTGNSIDLFLKYPTLRIDPAQMDKFLRLKVIYQRASSLAPEFLARKTIHYSHISAIPDKVDETLETITISPAQISLAELYQKLALQFEPK
ncbi:MAG TPA: hypothetical protein VJA23_04800 [Candidatus Nanoarchaeia archaeon]|nr:hypothetical protein [Candidatus Nanoarchaeia archaeon]